MASQRPAPADGLDRSKLQFVDVDGVRTRYYVDGAGPPLLLFSGGTFGSLYSLDAWSLNLPELAKDFQVYGVDKLGQGHTDPPKSDEEYTFQRVYQHAYGFTQTVGISQGCFVGHSRGALLVTWIALEHPDLVKKLIIVDSDSIAPELPMFPLRVFYNNLPAPSGPPSLDNVSIEARGQALWADQVTGDFKQRLLEIALLPKFQECQRRVSAIGRPQVLSTFERTRDEALRRIDRGELQTPTLVIWGLNDRSAPFPKGLRLFERIALKNPQTDMHILNTAGHYSFRDRYEAFNGAVKDFLSD